MARILLFGASGNLGRAIAAELHAHGSDFTVAVRSSKSADQLKRYTDQVILIDVLNTSSLNHVCDGFDVVISSLGKSVSPNDRSKATFNDIDLKGNLKILEQAKSAGIKKFVYISALHAERFRQLEYFRVHHEFSEQLKQSGIPYVIFEPPALFSAFIDIIELARKGQNIVFGKGDKKTNPIAEGDLAKIIVQSLNQINQVIQAGGKHIYTRRQLNEIVQQQVDPSKKVRSVPLPVIKFFLPLIKLIDRNLFDKIDFFVEVMKDDLFAAPLGETKFEDYIASKVKRLS